MNLFRLVHFESWSRGRLSRHPLGGLNHIRWKGITLNLKELDNILKAEKVKPNWYSIDGKVVPDRMIIQQIDGNWNVFYYGDRGEVTDETIYDNESAACEHLLKILRTQMIKQFGSPA